MKIQYEVLGQHQVREAHVAALPRYGETVWFEGDEGTERAYEVKVVFIKLFKEPPQPEDIVAEIRVVEV